jgi:hypothetical protein
MRDPLTMAAGWLALAVVLVALVELVPASNRPLTWTLGLILVYLVLTNADDFGRLVNRFVRSLSG